MCIMLITAILMTSEAMAASKQPWRSQMASESNSLTSITNVTVLPWPQNATIPACFAAGKSHSPTLHTFGEFSVCCYFLILNLLSKSADKTYHRQSCLVLYVNILRTVMACFCGTPSHLQINSLNLMRHAHRALWLNTQKFQFKHQSCYGPW